ncbi:hypothetical protein AB205_0191200, partial [Aquarana catesbeiana]
MTGDSVAAHGKRSPTAGRGRKTPEQSPPGGGGSPRRKGEVVGAKNKGQFNPGNGHPSMDNDIQSLPVGNLGTMTHRETNRWSLEETQITDTETMKGRGGEDPIPSMDRSIKQDHPKVIGGGTRVCGSSHRQAVVCDQESTQDGKGSLQGRNGQSTDPERDIWDLLKALPTKNDIQQLINAVEQSCMQAVESLKDDIRDLGYRVEEGMEKEQETTVQVVAYVQESMKKYEEILNSYRDQLDEYENRDRRQNIRIKGLKESITTIELAPTAQKIFGQIMGDQAPNIIEIAWIHRVPPYSTKADVPRDVICKVHKYAVKESIMKMARNNPMITFEGSNIALYPDISKRTL